MLPSSRRARFASRALSWLLCLPVAVVPLPAQARRLFRARFEVGTLEVEKPGALAIDAELGSIYGDGEDGLRLLLPDFELDLGVTEWLELDIDGGFTLLRLKERDQQWVGEPVWSALRFDLYSAEQEHTGRTFGIGLQLGPRWPSVRNVAGVGFAGLALVGGGTRSFHAVANLGSTIDRGQPPALNYGVSLELELPVGRKWALIGQVAGAHYFGGEHDQLFVNLGVSSELNEALELSLFALGGPAYQGDRFGLLAGMTYRSELW